MIDDEEDRADAAMRGLARALWDNHGESFSHSEDIDPVSPAPLYLNSWPGDIARFWMNAIDRRWRNHRDDWKGLNEEERDAIEDLFAGPRHALDAIEPAFASQAFFMFAADPEFTERRVLPLFGHEVSAKLAWTAFLYQPRYNDRMLAAGLLQSTIRQWGHMDDLGERGLEVNFFGMVASIVSFAAIPAKSRKQLLDASILEDEGKHASGFAREIVHFLAGAGINGDEIWKKWLRRHLQARFQGVPRTAEADELSVWADVVPYLGPRIPEAVKLFAEHDDIPLSEHFMEPDFPEGALTSFGAEIVEYYVQRVRASTPNNFMVSYHVNGLVETLTARLGKAAVKPITDAARERGFIA
ncbi:hypothetical protein [Streptomyces sp. L7]